MGLFEAQKITSDIKSDTGMDYKGVYDVATKTELLGIPLIYYATAFLVIGIIIFYLIKDRRKEK